MNPCQHISHYLDGRLERAGRRSFEEHLGVCPECLRVVEAWSRVESGLKGEARRRTASLAPSLGEAERLVERARLQREPVIPRRGRVLGLAAAGAAALFLIGGLAGIFTGERVTTVKIAPGQPRKIAETVLYETTGDGRTTGRLGRDRFGLSPSSRLQVVETGDRTVLALERGSAAFAVSPKKAHQGFEVRAGRYRVVVVGTRFSVTLKGESDLEVCVSEGTVKVLGDGAQRYTIPAGETLSITGDGGAQRGRTTDPDSIRMARLLGEALPKAVVATADPPVAPKTSEKTPAATIAKPVLPRLANGPRSQKPRKTETRNTAEADTGDKLSAADTDSSAKEEEELRIPEGIDLWRSWVLEGRLEEAERAIEEHVKTQPMDADAYSLLADCRRKSGKWRPAVEAYQRVIAITGGFEANRARFKAGVLLQERLNDHWKAATLFEDYLLAGKGTSVLRAKASLRLARSLMALGEFESARRLLTQVVNDYGGTTAAISAREMLAELP